MARQIYPNASKLKKQLQHSEAENARLQEEILLLTAGIEASTDKAETVKSGDVETKNQTVSFEVPPSPKEQLDIHTLRDETLSQTPSVEQLAPTELPDLSLGKMERFMAKAWLDLEYRLTLLELGVK